MPNDKETTVLSRLRQRLVRPWAILPLAVVTAGGTWFVSQSTGDDDTPATTIERTVEVTSGTLGQTVAAPGTIEAASTDQLSFASAGTVTAVNVEAGDEVAADDVLAEIDSAELEAAVIQAEASVADAEAQLDTDQNAGASEAQIAADESSLESAQRQLDAANEALAGAQLVASIDGTVSAVNISVGEQLGSSGTSGTDMTGSASGSGQSSSTLGSDNAATTEAQAGGTSSEEASPNIEVISTGAYVVTLSIDDTQIDRVEEGQEATITLSSSASSGPAGAFPGGGAFAGGGQAGGRGGGESESGEGADAEDAEPAAAEAGATGTVTSVGAIADASSGVATYPVEVTFEGAADEFHVGATADVEIVYEEIADAVQVPAQAVTSTDGRSTVIVVGDDGDRETGTIETGITSGGMVQVTSGLEAGEQVLITMQTGRPAGDDDGDSPAGGGEFTPPEGFEPPQGGFGGAGSPGRGPDGGAGG